MPALRRPTLPEVALQIVLTFFLILGTAEYFNARDARACSEPMRHAQDWDCYPWGTEGPVSELPDYPKSREDYLARKPGARTLLLVVTFGLAILAPFFTRRPKHALIVTGILLASAAAGGRLISALAGV